MNQYVTLMGAEQVDRAASKMQTAAENMQNAASRMEFALDGHHRFMNDWLNQFQLLLEKHLPAKDT